MHESGDKINYYSSILFLTLLLLHPFNGHFSWTTWVSWHQKGKTSLDLNEARDDRVLGMQWHQLDQTQTVCISLQTDNHTTPRYSIFTGRMLFLMRMKPRNRKNNKKLSYRRGTT